MTRRHGGLLRITTAIALLTLLALPAFSGSECLRTQVLKASPSAVQGEATAAFCERTTEVSAFLVLPSPPTSLGAIVPAGRTTAPAAVRDTVVHSSSPSWPQKAATPLHQVLRI